ncbi:MAG: MFS transporter [Burkholderiales bacterium]|nr:MFS transporter [Burkholderiales bacterium]
MLCGALILTVAMGVRATAGLFMPPMSMAYGWPRETFAFAFALQNLIWGAANPFFGAVADRYGAGRALTAGALLYCAGLALMAYSATPAALYGSAGLMIGLGLAGTTFGVVLGVVARVVAPEKRSMALGLVAAGGSLGQFIMLPVGQGLIDAFQWQGALIALALVCGCMVPLAAALVGKGEAAASGQTIGAALREAGLHRSFHFLFWSYFVCGFHTAFITLHLPAYVQDHGLAVGVGVKAIALIGLFNILGTYTAGWLGTHWSKKGLLAGIYAGRSVAIAGLLIAPVSPISIYVFAAAMGFLWLGTVPLTNALVAQIYGTRYVSMLAGVVFFGHQIGSFLGAWLGGAIYDRTGSYDLVWQLSLALGLIAAALAWPVDERPLRRAQMEAA